MSMTLERAPLDVAETARESMKELAVGVDRERFLGQLVGEVASTLQETVGCDAASGFLNLVGQRLGDWVDDAYRRELRCTALGQDLVAAVLLDIERRLHGDFSLVEQAADKLVFENNRCPFGEAVRGRTSLCALTSNVFGTVAAQNLGTAKVHLERTIAKGDAGCRVLVQLDQDGGPPADGCDCREYYKV